MEFKKVKINIKSKNIDFIIMKLMDLNINGFEIEDEEEFRDFINKKSQYWDYIDENLVKNFNSSGIIVYLSNDYQGKETYLKLKELINELKNDFSEISLKVENVKEEDWENNWKDYFKTFKIGKNFIIKPSWEDYERITKSEKIINIDPKSSFGTGKHETTHLCLLEIENYIKKYDTVLDMGCGSAILSIGAFHYGAKKIVAVDIDESCIRIARENVEINGFSENFSTFVGDITKDNDLYEKIILEKYDVIIANIVADVIIKMSEIFSNLIKPDGTLIVSGIINNREHEVINSLLEKNFKLEKRNQKNDWICLVLKR